MRLARRVVSVLLESDFDEEDMLRQMAQVAADAGTKKLVPGEEICRATGNSEDVADAIMQTLDRLNRPLAHDIEFNHREEFEALSRVSNGEATDDDRSTVDYLAYELLDRVIQKFVLPFTYVGSHEGDGTYGCWPNIEGLEEAAENEEITRLDYGNPQTQEFLNGTLQVNTEYVWIHNDTDYTDALYHGPSRKLVWKY